MTASQLHTLPIPPMLIINSGSSSLSVIPNRIIGIGGGGNNLSSRFRAKRNLFGAPPPGEIKRICDEDNMRKCIEFKEKYNYDIQNERFTYNNNNSNNNKNEDKTEITTTTTTTTTTAHQQKTAIQITELINNGQDEQSNINNILTKTTIEIDNNNDDNNKSIIIDVPSSSTIDKSVISKNLLIRKNYNDSECDVNGNNDDDNQLSKYNHIGNDDDNNVVGKSNITKSLNDDNKLNNSFNKCDVMCNQINSTTSSTITSTSVSVPTIKNKKSIDIVVQQQQQRFTPYSKKQILISDILKVRKASPANVINRPQKAKLHFDETDQQQQEQHLTSNEV